MAYIRIWEWGSNSFELAKYPQQLEFNNKVNYQKYVTYYWNIRIGVMIHRMQHFGMIYGWNVWDIKMPDL